MTRRMDKEFLQKATVTSMTGNGLTISIMEKAHLQQEMEVSTSETLRIINKTDLEFILILVEKDMKASIKME